MRLSIIIPAYNVEEYIEECINSVIGGILGECEIILIDDGSTDTTGKICDEYASRYAYITSLYQQNGGVTSARRMGLNNAKGDYIWFIDSDDLIEKNAIELIMKYINSYDLDVIGFSYDRFNVGNVVVSHGMKHKYYFMENDQEYIHRNIFTCDENNERGIIRSLCTFVFRTEIMKRVYNTISDRVQYAEDTALPIAAILSSREFVLINDVLYHVRVREGSIMHSKNCDYYEHISSFYKYLKDFFEKNILSEQLQQSLDRYMDELLILGLNKAFHYDNNIRFPSYFYDISGLGNKKIVLYGAAIVGQSYKMFFRSCGLEVVLWVDKNWDKYQKFGLKVESVDTIENTLYDIIIVAVERENLSIVIRNELSTKYGINKKNIIWKRPIHILDYYQSNLI